MFNFFKKKEVAVQEQSAREKHLERECERLHEIVEDAKKKSREATFVFDFSAVKVVSIERNWKDGVEFTVLGFLLDDQIINKDGTIIDKQILKEWYLYCSDVQHEKLVKEFNEFRKGK